MSPAWGLTPRLTDWLTVSRNVTLTLGLLNYGLTELDLASYRRKLPNSFQEHPIAEMLKIYFMCYCSSNFWSGINICSYDWRVSNKSIQLIQNPLFISHVTRIRDNIYIYDLNICFNIPYKLVWTLWRTYWTAVSTLLFTVTVQYRRISVISERTVYNEDWLPSGLGN
jgi:hypothetical protein